MNRKDENRFKNQNRECDIVFQAIPNAEFDYSYLSYHI